MNPSICILLAVLFPALGGLVLLIGSLCGSTGNGRGVALLATLGAFASVLCGIYFGQLENLNSSIAIPLFENLSGSGVPTRGTFSFHCDLIAAAWICLLSWGVFDIISGTRLSAPAVRRVETIFALLTLTVTICAMLSADLWWQWCFVCLSSWAVTGLLIAHQGVESEKSILPYCVTLLAADLLWLLGIMGLFSVFGTYSLSQLTHLDRIENLSAYEQALVSMACLWLTGSLLVRSAMFPFMGQTQRLTKTLRTTGWLLLFPTSLSVYLLFRYLPLLGNDAGARTLMAGIAVLSIIFLPLMTFGKQSPAHCLLRLTTASLALVWISLGALPDELPAMLGYSLAVILIGLVTITYLEAPKDRSHLRIAVLALLLFGCGVLGQERVFRIAEFVAANPQGVRLPASVPYLVLVAHGLICFGFARLIFPRLSTSLTMPIHRPLWSNLVTLAFAVSLPWIASELDGDGYSLIVPRLCFVILVVVLILTRIFATAKMSSLPESLIRLSEEEFYTPRMIEILIAKPVQLLVRTMALIEAEFFQKTLPGIWKLLPDLKDSSETHSFDNKRQLLTITLAAAVMGIALILAEVL